MQIDKEQNAVCQEPGLPTDEASLPAVSTAPIFIVGSPRSGTTLLSAKLSAHSRLCCGPETQFFNKLDIPGLQAALGGRHWVTAVLDQLDELTLSGQKVMDLFGESRAGLGSYLDQQTPAIGVVLEGLCSRYASRHGKPRWIEKTPNHILHLSLLRAEFPRARIIRIMRDPRDSALSMTRLPWSSDSFVENAYLWKDWYRASEQFLRTDPGSLTIRYEDLVADEEHVLKQICAFIGEDYESAMRDTRQSGKQVSSLGEPWKKQVAGRLDSQRCGVWKRELTGAQQQFAALLFHDILSQFGYEGGLLPAQTLSAFPARRSVVVENETRLIELAGQGISVDKLSRLREVHGRDILFLKRRRFASWQSHVMYATYQFAAKQYCRLRAASLKTC